MKKKIEREGNHVTEITKHKGGRQDVTIRVGTLNVDEKTSAGKKAKEFIEKKIIPELANRVVVVTVIQKSTGHFTSSKVKLPRVREWANAVIKTKPTNIEHDFMIVEHEGDQVRVSSL